jgi:hypothetical protein
MTELIDKDFEEGRFLTKAEWLAKLVTAQREYIELLGKELDGLVGMAHVHGWKSSLVEQGIAMREKMKRIEDKLTVIAP